MATEMSDIIIAVVTMDREAVGGDVPIFYARNEEERERIATTLCRITKGMAHDLENGAYVIVRH